MGINNARYRKYCLDFNINSLGFVMTLPGLALFYAGLVKSKNILSVLMHCIAIACLASLIWLGVGYSMAFSDGSPWVGGLQRTFLSGVERDSLSGDIPEQNSIFYVSDDFCYNYTSTYGWGLCREN